MLSASQYTALRSITNCPGPTGATGRNGNNGAKGDTGEKGENGAKGSTGFGATGPGSEISPSYSVRAIAGTTGDTGTPPSFEWSHSGIDNWSSDGVSIPDYEGFATLDANAEIRGLIFNGNIWVCSVFVKTASATNYPQLLYSSNGKIWTPSLSTPFRASGDTSDAIRGAYKIAYNGQIFLAVGTSSATTNVSIAYSIDNGITWTAVASSRANVMPIGRGIAWNGKVWLLTGSPTDIRSVFYSLNGITWNYPPSGEGSPYILEGYSVATNGKRWVIVGAMPDDVSFPLLSDSITGSSNWRQVSTWPIDENTASTIVTDISWNGRQWVSVVSQTNTGYSTVLISDDGDNWVTTGVTAAEFNLATSLTWNSLAWIVTGASGIGGDNKRLLYSINNGTNWIPITSTKAATSIASRTISNLFYSVTPYINVRDFGAIGDGTTSDAGAFTSALAYAVRHPNGARVIVPAGTYRYGDTLNVPINIEFVQETGARIVNSSGNPANIGYTAHSTLTRSRITKNDDEKNGLSSYNGSFMNGLYATGGGLSNDDTRSVANMFDVNSDTRIIGKPISIKIATPSNLSSSEFDITASDNTLPPVKIGNAIRFNSQSGTLSPLLIYYIHTLAISGTIARITLSDASLSETNVVGSVSSGTLGTVYDSTDVYGSTLTGRAILSTLNLPSGGRIGVEGRVEQSATTPALTNLNKRYVGLSGISTTSSGDGGTNLTTAARGEYFGGKFGASLVGNSATNVRSIIGAQFDVTVPGGTASSKYVFGASSVNSIAGITGGTKANAAYQIGGATGTTGWLHGILFSDASGGTPLKAGSSVLGTYWDVAGTRTITNGIDLSGFEMTGNVLASPRLQIKDTPSGTPTITTAEESALAIVSGNTERIRVTSSDTTFTGSLYAPYIQSAASGNIKLELKSQGDGDVEISSPGTGKVKLNSDTEVPVNKKLTITSKLGLGTSSNRCALEDGATGTTAYITGTLDSDGTITASNISAVTLAVNSQGERKIKLGLTSSSRAGFGNSGGGDANTAYVSGTLNSNGTIAADTISSGTYSSSDGTFLFKKSSTPAIVRIKNTDNESLYIQASATNGFATLASNDEQSFVAMTDLSSRMTNRNSFRVENTRTDTTVGFKSEEGPRIIADKDGLQFYDNTTAASSTISGVSTTGGSNVVYTLSSTLPVKLHNLATLFSVSGVVGGTNLNYTGFKSGIVNSTGTTVTVANDFSAAGPSSSAGGTLRYFNATAAGMTIGSTGPTIATGKILTITNGTTANGSTNITTHALNLGTDGSTGTIGIATSHTASSNASIVITPKGTGTISLNGDTAVVSGKKLTVTTTLALGTSASPLTLQDTTGSGTAFVTGNLNSTGAIVSNNINSSFPLKSYIPPTVAATANQVVWDQSIKTAGIYRITLTYLNNAAIGSATGSNPVLTLVQYHVLKTQNIISFGLTTLIGGATLYFDVSSNNIIKNSTIVSGAFAHVIEERLA